jgi:hypothetical protein
MPRTNRKPRTKSTNESTATNGAYDQIEMLQKVIAAEARSWAAIEGAAFPVAVAFMSRLDRLGDRIEQALNSFLYNQHEHRMIVTGLHDLLNLQGQLVKLLAAGLDICAKAVGINYDDMQGSAQLWVACNELARQRPIGTEASTRSRANVFPAGQSGAEPVQSTIPGDRTRGVQ